MSCKDCGKCGKPMVDYQPNRRWHDECESESERARRLSKMARRREREEVSPVAMSGRTLTCACGLCGQTFVTKAGRQRIYSATCPNRHRNRMGVARAPLADGEKYDKFAKLPETPCACGTGCGLTFRKVAGQRGRKWADGCPARAERVRAQNAAAYALRKHKRNTLGAAPGRVSAINDPSARPRVKVCQECYNLPHARALPCCSGCGLPAVPMTAAETEFCSRVRTGLGDSC